MQPNGATWASTGETMKAITLLVAAAAAAAALITTASAAEVSCSAGFVLLGGNTCIKVFTDTVAWEVAQAACSAIDIVVAGHAHLAYVDDCSLISSLWAYVHYRLGLEVDLWLGGSDSAAEGEWEWLDGRAIPLGVPYWHPHQPDGADLESKLVFSHDGFFADAHEELSLGYICQYTP